MNVTRKLLVGAAAVVLALGMSSSALLADPGHGRGRGHGNGNGHGHGHGHKHHRVERRPVYHSFARESFVVPHRIVRTEAYSPYYSGRVWYGPHRHAHAVYAFPVYSAYGVAYDPHYYCGSELYVGVPGYTYDARYASRAPRVSVGIHLGF